MSYPRTGGTLLAKMLQRHSKVGLVSEVHPDYTSLYPLDFQLKNWFDIESSGNYRIDLNTYIQKMWEMNKIPVIRDFSCFDFNKVTKEQEVEPTNLKLLLNEGYNVVRIALVRNAFDVWLSQKTPDHFGAQYLSYVKSIIQHQFEIFKYDDLCDKPNQILSEIMQRMNLDQEAKQLLDLKNLDKITGDISIDYGSRGFERDGILKLKRRAIPLMKLTTALWNSDMKKANDLLNYSTSIFEEDFQKNKIKLTR
ncbi:MAG: hypothetical protein H6600_05055 [Flavobacteriales bacterium]|nr:hypothetical protein [Flavobacteriales bacterium]MCB9197806.1 hypothetical protein [Flavobacteriales bacterium]